MSQILKQFFKANTTMRRVIVELQIRVKKPSYVLWRHKSSYKLGFLIFIIFETCISIRIFKLVTRKFVLQLKNLYNSVRKLGFVTWLLPVPKTIIFISKNVFFISSFFLIFFAVPTYFLYITTNIFQYII